MVILASRYHVWNPWCTLFLTSSAGSVVLFVLSLISSVLLLLIFFSNLSWSILLLFSPVFLLHYVSSCSPPSDITQFWSPFLWAESFSAVLLFCYFLWWPCSVWFALFSLYSTKKQTLIYFTHVSPSLQLSLLPVLLVAMTPVNQISFLIFNFRYSDFDILFCNIFNLLAWSTNVLLCYNPMGWSAQLHSGSSSDCLGRSLSVVHHTLGLQHQGPRCWSRYTHTLSHTRLNCSHQATSINHLCLWSSDCPQTQTHTHLLIHWGVCVSLCVWERAIYQGDR